MPLVSIVGFRFPLLSSMDDAPPTVRSAGTGEQPACVPWMNGAAPPSAVAPAVLAASAGSQGRPYCLPDWSQGSTDLLAPMKPGGGGSWSLVMRTRLCL